MKIVNKPFQQSELLLKEIDKLLQAISDKLQAVFVVKGPGDFSALRIGIATANALAYVQKIPVVGIKLKKSWADLEERLKLEKIYTEGLKNLRTKGQKNKITIVTPEYGKAPNIG